MRLDDLKNKILQLAIQGKLVAQNSKDTSVEVLLKRSSDEKEQLIKDKKIKREKELPEITAEEKAFKLPNGWKWCRLGDIGLTNIGLTYKPNEINDNGIPVLRSTNIQNGKIDLNDLVCVITKIPENKMCKKEDILICARNGSKNLVGKCAIIEEEGMSFGAFMAIYRSNYNRYIQLFINSDLFRSQLGDANTVTINQITQSMLRNIVCPFPPLEEQERIVAKVNEIFKLIDELNNNKEAMLKSISNSRNKLLKLAMQGKLVEQCEDDEPTKELLEEIIAEKEKLIKEKIIKKEKSLTEITEEEKSFDIPKGWEWCRLGEIVQINPRNKAEDEIEVSFMPMSLINDGYNGNHDSEVRAWKEVKSGFTHFAENDVVVAKITPCFENRKSAIMKNLKNGIGAGTTELYVFRPYKKLILPEFIFRLVTSKEFIEGGKSTYTGTAGQQRVKKEFIENYVLAVPPLSEQKRIVDKVDIVMAYLDALQEEIEAQNISTSIDFE